MTDRGDAEADEIAFSQIGKDARIDIVLAECLAILVKTQPPQPFVEINRHALLTVERECGRHCSARPRDAPASIRSQADPSPEVCTHLAGWRDRSRDRFWQRINALRVT